MRALATRTLQDVVENDEYAVEQIISDSSSHQRSHTPAYTGKGAFGSSTLGCDTYYFTRSLLISLFMLNPISTTTVGQVVDTVV